MWFSPINNKKCFEKTLKVISLIYEKRKTLPYCKIVLKLRVRFILHLKCTSSYIIVFTILFTRIHTHQSRFYITFALQLNGISEANQFAPVIQKNLIESANRPLCMHRISTDRVMSFLWSFNFDFILEYNLDVKFYMYLIVA